MDLGIRIDENAPVRKLIEICDELDYTDLYAAYLRHWRKIDPRTMFELHREKCFKGQYEKRKISLSQTFARQKREASERINTPEGIKLRVNRSIQVEGAFGVIKEDYGFRRFLTRGKRVFWRSFI